jgi:hypothetical protein
LHPPIQEIISGQPPAPAATKAGSRCTATCVLRACPLSPRGAGCIKTPIRYTQRILCIPEYTQTIPGERLWDTYDPHQNLCDTKWGFMSHKMSCATPATHNDRTRPAAGTTVRGAGVAA